jgi:hypothetical protein
MKVERLIESTFESAAAPKSLNFLRAKYLGMPALLLALLIFYGCPPSPPAVVTLPTVQPSCTVSPSQFAGWFASDTVTLNGVVNPAASDAFSNNPNCDFYKWSEQMFLWVTSPAPAIYGAGSHVFDSDVFFDVTPEVNGTRTLVQHTPGLLKAFALRAAQNGPDNLPIIIGKLGQMLEIVPPKLAPDGKQQLLNSAGDTVEIERAEMGENGTPMFFDKSNNVIKGARPIIPPELLRLRSDKLVTLVQKFQIGTNPVFLGAGGTVIQVEQGQADGGVLRAQNGSLIYFGVMVNDVYAYQMTGLKDGAIPAPGNNVNNAHFPTSTSDMTPIISFASAHGKTFQDPHALAVELKSSWIDASTLADPNDYITATGTVPTYDTTNPNLWTQTGTKTIKLALIGIHVVGSTIGHPEMIWATFEHQSNAPNATYKYINTSGNLDSVVQNTAGNWLFCASNSTGPFNQVHMTSSGNTIVSTGGFTISPSNTLRMKPWGGGSDLSPNPFDATTAISNTEIISINNSVRGMLASGDVRGNYIFTGATWTAGGAAPTADFPPFPPNNEVGTSKLSNATMETYQQGSNSLQGTGQNCLDCHRNNTVNVSFMFGPLKPLF